MSVRRKHESLPPRLILETIPIEEINIEARKHREEGINGALRLASNRYFCARVYPTMI